ncbi:MAG: glycosyltransferase family 2 protein, partial [Thermomicrobiales bacterium]
ARFVEVPVNYLPRIGVSAVTGDLWKAWKLGWQMIAFILAFRIRTLGKSQRSPQPILPDLTHPATIATDGDHW